MKSLLWGSSIKSALSLEVALVILLFPACGLLLPPAGLAQKIPMPGNPRMAGTWCPKCKEYFDTPNGRLPSVCPHGCGYSFVQQTKPAPQATPRLKPIDPFGDYLFEDTPIIPEDGQLKTHHFDSNGLAVRAEEWGRQMKQLDGRSREQQQTQAQDFERAKQELLKARGNGSALRQLKNVYADDEAWDSSGKSRAEGDPNVVDLRNSRNLKPGLLRNPSSDPVAAPGSPISGASSEHAHIRQMTEEAKYAHMSPDELDSIAGQYPGNAEIQQAITSLKAKTKSRDNLGAWTEQAREKEETMTSETAKGNREAVRATSTVLGLTANVPGGLDEVLYGEKTPVQWLGIDLASDKIGDRVQDFSVAQADRYALSQGWKTPDSVKKLGGIAGVVEGAAAVPELIDLYKTADKAGTHYVNAGELSAELQAAGGTGSAVRKWSDMRDDALAESTRLARLIEEEKNRARQTTAP